VLQNSETLYFGLVTSKRQVA